MSIVAALIFAAVSPLASPSDYVFAPFANESNAVSFIKGEIMGAGADYKSISAEDLAFLQEAMSERGALSGGSWGVFTNATEGLKIKEWAGWSVNPDVGFSKYINSSAGLPSGKFMCEYLKPITNETEYSWNTTDIIDRTVTATTNWVSGGTNTFRADWPRLATMQVLQVTNYTYSTTNEWITNVSYMAWMDCITTNESVFARKGTNDPYVSSLGVWRLHDQIPLFAAVTNMYRTLALGKYLLNSSAQYDTTSNRFSKIASEHSHYVDYYDGDPDNENLEWVKYEYGPTSRSTFRIEQYVVGGVYELSGVATKDASFGSYRTEQGWKYEMSPTEITEYSEELYPSNNIGVAELIISHITIDVATRGNHVRIKNPVRLYHPFKLDYSETIRHSTPKDGSQVFTNSYNKAGTAYGIACVDGLCDLSGTNRVTITASIEMKPMFTYMAGSVGLIYTTPESIVADNLPEPRDATYEYDGQTIRGCTSSSLIVGHTLSLVGAPIILYECDFSADVN